MASALAAEAEGGAGDQPGRGDGQGRGVDQVDHWQPRRRIGQEPGQRRIVGRQQLDPPTPPGSTVLRFAQRLSGEPSEGALGVGLDDAILVGRTDQPVDVADGGHQVEGLDRERTTR